MHIEFVEIASFGSCCRHAWIYRPPQHFSSAPTTVARRRQCSQCAAFCRHAAAPFEITTLPCATGRRSLRSGKLDRSARRRGRRRSSRRSLGQRSPTLDLWLYVETGEMHHVRDLILTLDWEGGRLGVRLRYEPKDLDLLYKDFMGAVSDAEAMKAAAIAAAVAAEHPDAGPPLDLPVNDLAGEPCRLPGKRLSTHFTIRAYSLDRQARGARKFSGATAGAAARIAAGRRRSLERPNPCNDIPHNAGSVRSSPAKMTRTSQPPQRAAVCRTN